MLEKSTYHSTKRQVKCLCRKHLLSLCDDMELNDYERNLLIDFYDDKSRIQTCFDLCISEATYTKDMKILFTKICDYKNTLN